MGTLQTWSSALTKKWISIPINLIVTFPINFFIMKKRTYIPPSSNFFFFMSLFFFQNSKTALLLKFFAELPYFFLHSSTPPLAVAGYPKKWRKWTYEVLFHFFFKIFKCPASGTCEIPCPFFFKIFKCPTCEIPCHFFFKFLNTSCGVFSDFF